MAPVVMTWSMKFHGGSKTFPDLFPSFDYEVGMVRVWVYPGNPLTVGVCVTIRCNRKNLDSKFVSNFTYYPPPMSTSTRIFCVVGAIHNLDEWHPPHKICEC